MNNINDPSQHGCSNPADERELCARNCENYCAHEHGRDAWLSETDTWYCEDCLVDYFIDELRGATGYDEELESATFIAHTDDGDEFTHFAMILLSGTVMEITLARLENERKENRT